MISMSLCLGFISVLFRRALLKDFAGLLLDDGFKKTLSSPLSVDHTSLFGVDAMCTANVKRSRNVEVT